MMLEFPVLSDSALLYCDGLTIYACHGHHDFPTMEKGDVVVVTDLENINVGERGYIRPIGGGGVHTSTIQEVDYLCEGDIRIVTRNSIYELTSMDGDDDAS